LIWDISTKLGLLIDVDLLKAVTSTDTKPEVVFSRRGRHLQKWISRHISAVAPSILTKFGSLVQNNGQISGKWSKSKVDFQHGGLMFFKNGSSYISAINWDMSTKFGLLIDFDFLKAMTSTNMKPELLFSGRGRHFQSGNDVIFLRWVLRFQRNSVAWCRKTWKLREVVKIKTGSRIPLWRTFVKTEIVKSQPSIEIRRRNLVCS